MRACACARPHHLAHSRLTTMKLSEGKWYSYTAERCVQGTRTKVISFVTNEQQQQMKKMKKKIKGKNSFLLLFQSWSLSFFIVEKKKRHMDPIIICVISVSYLTYTHTHKTNEMKMELKFYFHKKMNKWNYVWKEDEKNEERNAKLRRKWWKKIHANEFSEFLFCNNEMEGIEWP